MQLKNLECQLALAQLKRYMGGAKLSDEALEALESHLVECTDCQLAVQAQKEARARAKSLMSHAVVETPAPAAAPESASVNAAPVSSKKLSLKGNGKILALSGGLALVLILMNSLARDPSKLFGERAEDLATPATAIVASPEPVPVAPVEIEQETAIASTSAERPEPAPTEPVKPAANVEQPAPSTPVRATAPRRPATTARRTPPRRARVPASRPASRPAPRIAAPAASGIVIYDDQGRPLR